MKGLILALLALAILVAACAAHVEKTTTQPVKTDDVAQAQQGLDQVDNLTSDLNFSDLDALDEELNFG